MHEPLYRYFVEHQCKSGVCVILIVPARKPSQSLLFYDFSGQQHYPGTIVMGLYRYWLGACRVCFAGYLRRLLFVRSRSCIDGHYRWVVFSVWHPTSCCSSIRLSNYNTCMCVCIISGSKFMCTIERFFEHCE